MDPADFFAIAERLVAREGREPRSERRRYHEYVKERLRSSLHGESCWRLFMHLHDYRVKADYFLDDERVSEKTVITARALADDILEDIASNVGSGGSSGDGDEAARFYDSVKGGGGRDR